MKPIDIPEEVHEAWQRFGWDKITLRAPEGLEEKVFDCETLVGVGELGTQFHMLIQIEDDDWKQIERAKGRFWLVISSPQLPPFQVFPFGEEGSNETISQEDFNKMMEEYRAVTNRQPPEHPDAQL